MNLRGCLLNLIKMKNILEDFKLEIKQSELSKTDEYWLEQVIFKLEDKNLNIIVNSEFIKSSIEKKLYEKIKFSYKKVTGFDDCVFVLDKNMKKPENKVYFEEKVVDKEEIKIKVKNIEPDFSMFDDMFVGSSNNLAITAAKSVVSDPGKRFNPLFIYGAPGVGKTFLLKTIEGSHPSSFYIDSESFLDSYIRGIKNNDIDVFKSKIRSVDILLVDDIQFFMGKKGVSEELFHTINYFLNNEKSVVLVSDQKPEKLLGFPERLISRILNGLVTDIEKPDNEMFLKVLKKANKDHDGYLLSVDEISKLKKLQVNSFRDINGIINKILLNKQTGKNNSEYINELISDKSVDYLEAIKPEHLLNYVSKVFQVDKDLIVSKNRSNSVNESRRLFANLARNHTDLSLNQIGLYLGGRSHSTVLSYIERSKNSPMVVNEVNKFNNSLALKDVG